MTKTMIAIAAAVGLLAGPLAVAECQYPGALGEIPEGATASNDEMNAAYERVKTYMADMEAYLACLDDEASRMGEEVTAEQKQMQTERYNAAVSAMETTAAAFNDQLRAYKSANP